MLLVDILAAFYKLDLVEKIPDIYCEAISFPSLSLDPVSKRLEDNSNTVESGYQAQ